MQWEELVERDIEKIEEPLPEVAERGAHQDRNEQVLVNIEQDDGLRRDVSGGPA